MNIDKIYAEAIANEYAVKDTRNNNKYKIDLQEVCEPQIKQN